MSDLRKAAEMAWEYFETSRDLEEGELEIKNELAKALLKTLAYPEPEWVGLTDDEADKIVEKFIKPGGDVEDWEGYWKAIEAKLKEKNT